MKDKYHIVYITEFPTFYKTRLFNELEKSCHNLVIYINSEAVKKSRNNDFLNGEKRFDNIVVEGRKLSGVRSLFSILSKISYDEVILSGWDHSLYWLVSILNPKCKNSLIVESSYLESKVTGVSAWVKRLFLRRITKVYASGASQRKLVELLGYNGKVVITKGVGVFNYIPQPPYAPKDTVKKFIYVGRFVEVKNLKFLVNVFNSLPQYELYLAGFGEQEEELRSMSYKNIHFLGAIENAKLSEVYQQMDVFVLPSMCEPWGLVVEEALNNGLPVILSDRVGCAEEIIDDKKGIIFTTNNPDSLKEAILKISTDLSLYNSMRKTISELNFEEIEQYQVDCYKS